MLFRVSAGRVRFDSYDAMTTNTADSFRLFPRPAESKATISRYGRSLTKIFCGLPPARRGKVTIPDYVALKPGAYEWKLFPIVEERIVHKATLEGFRLKDSGDTTAKPN